MPDWNQITEQIRLHTGTDFNPAEPSSIGGGCINSAVRLGDGHRDYFIKFNSATMLAMFEAEHQGLEAMFATGTIRVPQPICHGISETHAYLVLEHIKLSPNGDSALAGRQLAAMHRHTRPRFGWHRDNTIGSTSQPNQEEADWIRFWHKQRLGHQLRLAADRGIGRRLLQRGERLLEQLPALLDHSPVPSLLHGDLWSGNIGYDSSGVPVIFDPATYYGDRETDLAMTELFGSPGKHFYSAYHEAWPIDPGYATRKTLYNLYHIINHYNLFGGGYASQAEGMIDRLLAELGR